MRELHRPYRGQVLYGLQVEAALSQSSTLPARRLNLVRSEVWDPLDAGQKEQVRAGLQAALGKQGLDVKRWTSVEGIFGLSVELAPNPRALSAALPHTRGLSAAAQSLAPLTRALTQLAKTDKIDRDQQRDVKMRLDLRRLAELQIATGNGRDAARTLTRVSDADRSAGKTEQVLVALESTRCWAKVGNTQNAMSALRRALAIARFLKTTDATLLCAVSDAKHELQLPEEGPDARALLAEAASVVTRRVDPDVGAKEHGRLGVSYAKQGRAADAERTLQSALRLALKVTPASERGDRLDYVVSCVVQIGESSTPETLSQARTALNRLPDRRTRAFALLKIAELATKKGEDALASTCLMEAKRLITGSKDELPQRVYDLAQLASSFRLVHRIEEAHEIAAKASKLFPPLPLPDVAAKDDWLDPLFELARELLAQNNTVGARQALELAERILGKPPRATRSAQEALTSTGQLPFMAMLGGKAAQSLQETLRDPQASARATHYAHWRVAFAGLRLRLGDTDAAKASFAAALRLMANESVSERVQTQMNVANAYADTGQVQQAISRMVAAVETTESNPLRAQAPGCLAALIGGVSQALETLSKPEPANKSG